MIFFKKKISRIRRFLKTRKMFKKIKSIRLVVHRSSRHIYAQIISENNLVLASASTLEKKVKEENIYTGNKEFAKLIGKKIALRSLKKGIKKVSFDRSGFKYHGRIKELADSARKFGLKF
ncbi:50S ribosomal protein L18 [Buchnera aphidicola (Ceratoglyphina bambusae)]|uniref:50S ribosomal protein L18 n=1 Tax=Buchnera aphidicola TaxID=9 RepID=UPI0031B8624B